MRILLAAILSFHLLLLPQVAFADAQTGECLTEGGVKSGAEVGAFLQGVCNECYDRGNCSIGDIQTVFVNISNFILSIVGSLVFLMYIMGGMYWLASRGNSGMVDKGKKYIIGSTVGLVIVLFAYAIVSTVERTLKSGDAGTVDVVICDGSPETEGEACGDNQVCASGICLTECAIRYPDGEKACSDTTAAPWDFMAECVGVGDCSAGYEDCETGLCPGAANIQCCHPPGWNQRQQDLEDNEDRLDEVLRDLSE